MEIFLYRKGAETIEEGFTRDELPELLADESNVVWVDIVAETGEQQEAAKDMLQNVFNFHRLTIEDCMEARNQPKVEGFEKYLFFIVHGIKPNETNALNFVTKELDGYLGSNFVVTYRVERFQSIKAVKKQLRSSTFIWQRGAAYLLHSIFDQLVDLYMPLVDDFDLAISRLEENVLNKRLSSNQSLSDIMALRRSVSRLRRISARQLEVLHRISRGEFPQIPQNVIPYYRDVHDHLVRITDLAENYRELVGGLFDIHFSVVANKTNNVMKTLAVLSTIILPLSLIAGIYGMNFDNMPELKSRNGYFLTLGLMALIAVALLVNFWRRGWIFQREDAAVIEKAMKEDYEEI